MKQTEWILDYKQVPRWYTDQVKKIIEQFVEYQLQDKKEFVTVDIRLNFLILSHNYTTDIVATISFDHIGLLVACVLISFWILRYRVCVD